MNKYKIQSYQKSNLVQEAMHNISRMIGEQNLEPGSRLPSESELCEIFNVSRVVIREAIAGLSAVGMIETRQGYGNVVSNFTNSLIKPHHLFIEADLESIVEAMDVRIILELGIARIAALNCSEEDIELIEEKYRCIVDAVEKDPEDINYISEKDFEFHMSIANCTKNRFIYRFLSNITDMLKTTIVEAFNENPKNLYQTVEEHRMIIEAIKAKDPVKAYNSMEKHLLITELTLKEKIANDKFAAQN